MIDQATNWIEIRSVLETRADLVANQVELAWLTRYFLPNKIMVDRGKEVLDKFKTMMANDYGIPCDSISVRDLHVNTIVERVHQTIGNIIHTFKIQQMDLDNENPWENFFNLLCLPYGLLCSPYCLRCTLLHSIHHHNWYLVVM